MNESNIYKKIFIIANIVIAAISIIIFLSIINSTIGQDTSNLYGVYDFGLYGTLNDNLYFAAFCSAVSVLFSMIMLIQKIGKSGIAVSIVVPTLFVFLCTFTILVCELVFGPYRGFVGV